MSLISEIEQDVKDATLARDAPRRDALRLILSSLRSAEKDLQRPLSGDEELQVLQRERKRRIEASEAFRAAGREEQASKEDGELAILEEFMPAPLSEEELERIVDDAIAENGATSMRDMGRVMAGRDAADRCRRADGAAPSGRSSARSSPRLRSVPALGPLGCPPGTVSLHCICSHIVRGGG